jgi:hypothetical protein
LLSNSICKYIMLQMQRGYNSSLFSANQRSQSSLHHLLKLRIWTNWNAEDQLIINLITSYIGEVKKPMPPTQNKRERDLITDHNILSRSWTRDFICPHSWSRSFLSSERFQDNTHIKWQDITCKVGKRLNKKNKTKIKFANEHGPTYSTIYPI